MRTQAAAANEGVTMISKLAKIITSAAVALALTSLAACSPGHQPTDKTSSAPTKKPVTIAAPPKADENNVQVRLTGPANSSVDVYAFSGGWNKNKKPTCTANNSPQTVQLDPNGNATARIDVDPGVVWWVVASSKTGVTSKCGASSTIVTFTPKLVFGGPDTPSNDLNAYQGTIAVGKPFKYWVNADRQAPAGAKGWTTTVKWLGPFSSAPEAHAQCQQHNAPVAAESKGQATWIQDTNGAVASGVFSVTLPKPGVYAVIATAAATEFSPAVTTPCDDTAPFLVAK